jgi:DnaK suppressor protein
VDVKRARARLEARLAEIGHSSAVLAAEGADQGGGELSHIRQHPGDQGTDLSDAEREVTVLDAAAADQRLIKEALERVENGTYGLCVDCGKKIPEARLKARPEVARCVADQQKFEALGRRR